MASSKPTEIGSSKMFEGFNKRYKHDSPTLGCSMNFHIYFPPSTSPDQRFPVLYWLSGLTCNDENFIIKSGAQRVASTEGIALIVPDTSPRGLNVEGEADSYDFGVGAGFYLNATVDKWKNWQMYDYIVKELPKVLSDNFPQLDTSRASISGHSMGGHGALTIYLKNLDKYKSVSAFAPIVNPINCPWGQKAFTNYLGDDKTAWEEYDATCLIKKFNDVAATIMIDQGDDDKFLHENQLLPSKFDEACRNVKAPLLLRMQPGYDHSYHFIATFIDDHIRHHAQALNPKRVDPRPPFNQCPDVRQAFFPTTSTFKGITMTTDADMSSWTDLLHSSSKLVEQAAPSAQFPPLQRNLDQLEALSTKLKSKTLRTEALFQSIAATRLFAREGINAEQLARDLKSFELKTTFEDVFPAEATSVEEYLQQVREMAMVSAVQEAQKDNLRNFSDYMMTVLEDDWQKEKKDFLHSLSRVSTLPRTKNKPGKDTLSPRSKRLKPAHPKKTEKEIRAFQKLKRKRIKHQSEASFMASILSDIAKAKGDEEEEEIEKEEEKVEGEEEKGKEEEEGKEEEKDESSEDETIFPLNQTVIEPQPPPKFTSISGKDDSTSPKTTHPSPPYHSPKSATEGPISRTEFQNLASVVQALDSKSEAILKAVQGLAASVPSLAEREKHLDQLISARLKHSMEESEARWTKSTKDFLELIESKVEELGFWYSFGRVPSSEYSETRGVLGEYSERVIS